MAVLAATALGLAFLAYHYYESAGFLREHMSAVEKLEQGKVRYTHVGFHVLSVLLHRLSGIPLRQACNLVLTLHVVFTFLALYHVLRLLGPVRAPPLLLILLALLLMAVAPIGIPYVSRSVYSFAGWNRAILFWRNPTHTCVQPYVILSFGYLYFFIEQFRRTGRASGSGLLLGGSALLASALVKPSFALNFIPALGLFALFGYRQRKLLVTLALALAPTVIAILIQAYVLFLNNPLGERSMVVDPLQVWTRNNKIPWLAFLLSVAFPLFMGMVRRRHLRASFHLALIGLAIACAPYALLRMSGDRDFEWGYWYGVHVLFLCAVLEWLYGRYSPDKGPGDVAPVLRTPLQWMGIALFAWHVAFGVLRLARSYPPL